MNDLNIFIDSLLFTWKRFDDTKNSWFAGDELNTFKKLRFIDCKTVAQNLDVTLQKKKH